MYHHTSGEHTEWTNSIFPVRKADASWRLCADPKDLSKNTKRNQYHTRTSRTPWFHILHSDGCQVRPLDSPIRQRKLTVDSIQHIPGKIQMVMATIWSVSQLRCLTERLDAVIRTLPGVTGIANDVLAKGDSEINHDIAVLSPLNKV